jgi:hypothetical protein
MTRSVSFLSIGKRFNMSFKMAFGHVLNSAGYKRFRAAFFGGPSSLSLKILQIYVFPTDRIAPIDPRPAR